MRARARAVEDARARARSEVARARAIFSRKSSEETKILAKNSVAQVNNGPKLARSIFFGRPSAPLCTKVGTVNYTGVPFAAEGGAVY